MGYKTLRFYQSNGQIFMKYMVFPGIVLTIVGLALILYVILIAIQLRSASKKDTVSDGDLRKKVGRLVPVNLIGLFLSAFGVILLFVAKMLS